MHTFRDRIIAIRTLSVITVISVIEHINEIIVMNIGVVSDAKYIINIKIYKVG